MKTCLHRLIGTCKDCKVDYESEVNNTHCWKYTEINLAFIEVTTTEVPNANFTSN